MAEVETTLRGPQAYQLAREALEQMEASKVWPTPLNFEIWLHYLGDPKGPLGAEIERMLDAGEPFTEEVSETLAATYLPRARLNEEIRDAGYQLSEELKSVASAIAVAQKTQEAYGRTLQVAGEGLQQAEPPEVKRLVDTLSAATRKVQIDNARLEKRLEESTREVNLLREHLEQVRRDAMTDALTALANRKAFDEHLARACAEADETNAPLCMALLDIDHFKRFNDTWGHQTGDQVLRYVASVIARVSAHPRVGARYGGEEFAMLFPRETASIVEAALNAVREEVASRQLKRRSTNEDLGSVTISAGVAQRRRGEEPSAFLERADEALYASKRGGRNRVTNAENAAAKAA